MFADDANAINFETRLPADENVVYCEYRDKSQIKIILVGLKPGARAEIITLPDARTKITFTMQGESIDYDVDRNTEGKWSSFARGTLKQKANLHDIKVSYGDLKCRCIENVPGMPEPILEPKVRSYQEESPKSRLKGPMAPE